MGIKKITRVWESLKWTLIFQTIIAIPLIVIITIVGMYVIEMIFPVADDKRTSLYEQMVKESVSSAAEGGWC